MFKKAIDLAQIPDYTGNSCVHKPTQKENQHESTPKKQPPLVRLQDQPPPPRLRPRQRQPPPKKQPQQRKQLQPPKRQRQPQKPRLPPQGIF